MNRWGHACKASGTVPDPRLRRLVMAAIIFIAESWEAWSQYAVLLLTLALRKSPVCWAWTSLWNSNNVLEGKEGTELHVRKCFQSVWGSSDTCGKHGGARQTEQREQIISSSWVSVIILGLPWENSLHGTGWVSYTLSPGQESFRPVLRCYSPICLICGLLPRKSRASPSRPEPWENLRHLSPGCAFLLIRSLPTGLLLLALSLRSARKLCKHEVRMGEH